MEKTSDGSKNDIRFKLLARRLTELPIEARNNRPPESLNFSRPPETAVQR